MPRPEHVHAWTIARRDGKRSTVWTARCGGCAAHLRITETGRHLRVTPPAIVDALLIFTAPDGALDEQEVEDAVPG